MPSVGEDKDEHFIPWVRLQIGATSLEDIISIYRWICKMHLSLTQKLPY